MKSKQLLGIALMTSAILLQVGYAATTVKEHTISTKRFDVYFNNPVVTKASPYVDVEIAENKTGIDVKVNNLYPGAYFNIETYIENYGEITAQIKDITLTLDEIKDVADKTYNPEMIDWLVGYDEAGRTYKGKEAYTDYLVSTYKGTKLAQGDTMPMKWSMGMAPEIEDMQDQIIGFTISINLEQVIESGGGSGGGNESGGGSQEPDVKPGPDTPDPSKPKPDVSTPDHQEENTPDVAQPGDEGIEPQEEVVENLPDIEQPQNPQEELPNQGTVGLLPKTGGVAPGIVYGIGFTLLASGLVIYRKKDE
ncbi:LPXTG cell wall anchor domain-containing protein [Niameybacter massiliensis]|uniref:LPXTG cell wall anchor domain-containing protein n=1 Tax=Holtiella tumoricola TaxID=3018743 RepID=A0AA42DQ40_9FIRM|nr:LPXTG cell wall anchor domain-containing protein [Holtiella tumoricola]MDA3733148.1 LPXTG cell wall anchor domain-containing protein [Holtiella tumoricola]